MLVVVPASLRLVWAEEFEKWLPHLRPSQIHVIEGREDRLAGRGDGVDMPLITITSFEMLRRLTCDACRQPLQGGPSTGSGSAAAAAPTSSAGSGYPSSSVAASSTTSAAEGHAPASLASSAVAAPPPQLQQPRLQDAPGAVGRPCLRPGCKGPGFCMAALPWGVVVVDESHNLRTTSIKNTDSPHTEACVTTLSRANRRILLTGTPSLAKPFDLYRQIDALVPELLGSKEDYAARYCDLRLVPRHAGRCDRSRMK